MTDHEKRIREALEAGPSEGPFHVVRGGAYCWDIKTTDSYDVATTHGYVRNQVDSLPTANFIAACNPSAIRALLADLDAARAALSEAKAGGWVCASQAQAQPAAMPELPEPELGYIETDKSRQPAFSARQMRAAMQAQPAAVSDEQMRAIDDAHDWQTTDGRMAAYRAILALRPQAVPMDQEAAWEASPVTSDWEAVDAYMQGIADAEAHHRITAPAGGEVA